MLFEFFFVFSPGLLGQKLLVGSRKIVAYGVPSNWKMQHVPTSTDRVFYHPVRQYEAILYTIFDLNVPNV